MLIGQFIFGGLGGGLYGIILWVLITMFVVGLMVGRNETYRPVYTRHTLNRSYPCCNRSCDKGWFGWFDDEYRAPWSYIHRLRVCVLQCQQRTKFRWTQRQQPVLQRNHCHCDAYRALCPVNSCHSARWSFLSSAHT